MHTTLRTFLRERRRRIDPASAGLPTRRGRRTSGLAREDMAELLEVTPLWYALFESGTSKRRFSKAFLGGVSHALRLDEVEQETFFRLVVANGNATPDVELELIGTCWSSVMNVAREASQRIADAADAELAVAVARRSLHSMLTIGESWRWSAR